MAATWDSVNDNIVPYALGVLQYPAVATPAGVFFSRDAFPSSLPLPSYYGDVIYPNYTSIVLSGYNASVFDVDPYTLVPIATPINVLPPPAVGLEILLRIDFYANEDGVNVGHLNYQSFNNKKSTSQPPMITLATADAAAGYITAPSASLAQQLAGLTAYVNSAYPTQLVMNNYDSGGMYINHLCLSCISYYIILYFQFCHHLKQLN